MADAVVVIGVGNPDRGDDGVGHRVVSHLEARGLPEAALHTTEGADPGTLIEKWRTAAAAYLADAMVSGAAPGTIRRFDAAAGPLPDGVRLASTHTLGAATALEMARALGRLPPVCVVYGIEGAGFEFDAGLSPEVEAAAGEVAEMIAAEVTAGGE